EVRVLLVKRLELLLELRQGEEVARLTATDGHRLVNGALAVFEVLLRLERLTALAVPALVTPLVDVAVVVHLLDELAAALVVARLARLDEVVEADLQGAPDLLELPGHVVAVGLRVQP